MVLYFKVWLRRRVSKRVPGRGVGVKKRGVKKLANTSQHQARGAHLLYKLEPLSFNQWMHKRLQLPHRVFIANNILAELHPVNSTCYHCIWEGSPHWCHCCTSSSIQLVDHVISTEDWNICCTYEA